MAAHFLSRKFLLSLGLATAATVFFALGKMTAAEWVGYTQIVLASYLALNVAQKGVEKKVRTP